MLIGPQGHSAAGRIMSMKNSNDLVFSAVSQQAAPKYYESVFVFFPYISGMQIGSLLLRIILSRVVCLAVPYLSTFHHKRHDLKKNLT
jgi:hypothetical protein